MDPTHFPVACQNYWDPLTSSTINHKSMPAVGQELPSNGQQHTVTYINRLQFELETTVTLSIEDSTKIELNNIGLHPCI